MFKTLFILFYLWSLTCVNKSFSQTYNKIITDQEYYDFINSDISNDSVKVLHHIFRKRISLNKKLLYYKDSTEYIKRNNGQYKDQFIFHHVVFKGRVFSNYLDTIFSKEDIVFFGEQLKAMRKNEYWKKEFKNSVFIDSLEYDYNGKDPFGREMKFGVWGYSLPLFASNKNYALIIKSNSVSRAYYIYRRSNKGEWNFVKKFNEWALDYW